MGATCPLAQGTLQGGLSTCHVKRLVRARLPASQVENRFNRENMLEQNNVKNSLRVHYQRGYLWINFSGGGGGTPLYVPHLRVWFLGLFGLKPGKHFAHFGLESGMGFEGTTGVYMNVFIVSIPNK